MRILFLHNNFPAQYRHVAQALAADKGNQVVFGTMNKDGAMPGVAKAYYKPSREPNEKTHHYLRGAENAVLHGQGVWRMCVELKKRGFVPDIVCGHSGWGPTLYVKDAFPNARQMNLFEWYYHSTGADSDFLPDHQQTDDDRTRIRTRNIPILLDLANADWGQVPTQFQRSQFPDVFLPKLSVLHEGIDTDFFKPAEERTGLVLPKLDLSGARELLTYSTRGMEPYRGFPQFMRAAAKVMARRPDLHVVVVGQDRIAYGRQLPEGDSWRKRMIEELKPDMSRLHFTGLLPYPDYLKVLQASHCHVYLTVPFVLSWSSMEAMAAGCLIVGSDTAPLREVITDGESGLLTDFFDIDAMAEKIIHALDNQKKLRGLREAARRTILEKYALKDLLPRHLRLIKDVAAGVIPPFEGQVAAAAAKAAGRKKKKE
jgi:glycosyltransferase involved in cell wall biosynthesis